MMNRFAGIIGRLTRMRSRRRLRQAMRGYRHLKLINRLDLILEIKNEITDTPIERIQPSASSDVFGNAKDKAELVVRQYLLSRLSGRDLNEELLRTIGNKTVKFCYAFPVEWLRIIEKNGLKVDYVRSGLMWAFFIVFRYLVAFIVIGKIVLKGRKPAGTLKKGRNYVFFNNLTSANLPEQSAGKKYDIISWYQQWPGKVTDLYGIYHDVKNASVIKIDDIIIEPMPGILPALSKIPSVLSYWVWAFMAIIRGFLDMLRGKWWNSLMLSEAALAALTRRLDPHCLAREYFFHNSGSIYRPLWTYEAERMGSRISFYFYSTNAENFKYPHRYPVQSNSWQVVSWSNYLVWDQYHAAFVRRIAGDNVKIIETGPIWFHSGSNRQLSIPGNAFSVFDVQPHRDSIYQVLGIDMEYYTPDIANQFLIDVYKAVTNNKGAVLFKQKRHIGKKIHRRYQRVLDEIKNKDHFYDIDPDVSAVNLIESSVAVISMPFTSTGKIGRFLGKPSIYYDPHGVIQKDDRAAHGIPVLIGFEELEKWVKVQIASIQAKSSNL